MTYEYKPGLGDVGSYQVSGKPFASGSIDCKAGPVRIQFPSVTSWIIIQNHDETLNDNLEVAFSEAGLPPGGTNFFTMHDATPSVVNQSAYRLDLKVCEIWIQGSQDVDVVAGLTGINCNQIPNNWSGSVGVG